MAKKKKEIEEIFDPRIGKPDHFEYTEQEIAKIKKCKEFHEFYMGGAMKGALKYCKRCKFGYTV